MRIGYHRRRLASFAAGMKLAKQLEAQSREPEAALRRRQQTQLEALVRHAREQSPFYRERLPDGPVVLDRLPVLEKPELMERYDDVVIDRRLHRDELLAWIESRRRDELLHGAYRVMTTSGSSGRKGLFVYDQAGWASIAAHFLRITAWLGVVPRLPRRRMAMLGAPSPTHMSVQGSVTLRVGAHRVLAVPVTQPIEQQVAALNAFRPDFLNAYPSAAVRLAEEQEAGRLRLSLENMSTSSELLTPAMAERLEAAFGVRPFNVYASTEGLFGAECERHDGVHLFEDVALVENVDEHGRAVPAGEPGARVLVTQLHNRVQPIIRLAVSDVFTLHPEPCPCGRRLVRAAAIEGRSDDVLSLPARAGGDVTVLPAQFAVVSRDRGVREFQVRQEAAGVRILVVPCAGADADLEQRVGVAVGRAMDALGAEASVAVERRDELTRRGGKLQIVVARPREG
jgi:putative adenylate-forming enzyme